ncbi:MAG: hypothetical protein ACHQ1D_01085 [Nitrososphaerales archaeon]
MKDKTAKREIEEICSALEDKQKSYPLGNLVGGIMSVAIGTYMLNEVTRGLKKEGLI